VIVMQETNENIDQTIELSRHLLHSADLSDLSCEDSGCHAFYSSVRDRASRILSDAEHERARDMTRGFPKTQKMQVIKFSGLTAALLRWWRSAKSIF
jgi:hypothetical protein